MQKEAYAFSILVPNDNQIKYMDISREITKERGFVAVSIKDRYIYFIFKTPKDAEDARIKALSLNLMIKGGLIRKVKFDEECLSKGYQESLKNEVYTLAMTAIAFEKLKNDK